MSDFENSGSAAEPMPSPTPTPSPVPGVPAAPTPAPPPPPSYTAPPAPGYAAAPGYAPPPPVLNKRKGMAIAALVLGIVGLPLFVVGIASLLGVIFGWIGMRRASKQPEAFGGKGMAIAGLVTGIVGLGIGVAFWVTNADEIKDGIEQASAGFDVKIGDCVKVPDGKVIAGLPKQPCDAPHGGEVYVVDELPAGEYPGQTEVQNTVVQKCVDAFEGFVGAAYGTSKYDAFFVYPREDRWKQDERGYVCFIVDKTGADLPAGTVKGSGD